MHNTDLKSGRHRQKVTRASRARAICSALLFGGGSVAPVPLFPIRNDDEKQPLSSLSPRSSMLAFVKCKAQNRKHDVTSAKSASNTMATKSQKGASALKLSIFLISLLLSLFAPPSRTLHSHWRRSFHSPSPSSLPLLPSSPLGRFSRFMKNGGHVRDV